jgi:formate C-acetyltransferase
VDSLAAIKYAKVHTIRDKTGPPPTSASTHRHHLVPQFGNNDDWVTHCVDLVTRFMQKIRKHPTYLNAPTPKAG